MRLLLLNLNYLQYQFFIKTMPKKSWILNTLPNGGNLRPPKIYVLRYAYPMKTAIRLGPIAHLKACVV